MKNQYGINKVAVLIESFLHDFLQHLQKKKEAVCRGGEAQHR